MFNNIVTVFFPIKRISAKAISKFEQVILLVTPEVYLKAKSEIDITSNNIKIALCEYDDIG
jgi:hypothetical protein